MPLPARFRRLFPLIAFLFISLLFVLLAQGPDLLRGDSAFLRLGAEFSAVLVVFFSALAPGWIIFKWLFKKVPGRQMEWLLTIAFGLCILSYLGFVLCALQLLQWPIIFSLLAGLSAAGLALGVPARITWNLLPAGIEKADALPLLVLAGLLGLGLIHALSPPQLWDEQTYHLLLPKLFLAHAGFFKVTSNIFAWFPQNLEMIFTLLSALSDAIAPRLFHWTLGLLLLLSLWNFGTEVFGVSRAGVWAMVLFGVSGAYELEASSAYLELGLSLWLVLSAYSIFRYRQSQETGWLATAAVLAGAGLATKYLALGPVLALALLVFSWSKQHRWRNSLAFLGLAGALVLPWLMRNWILIGNPFYPFLLQLFHGGEWDATLFQRYLYSQTLEGMGRTWHDYLLLLPRLFLSAREESFWFDVRYNPLLLVISLASLCFTSCRRQIWLGLLFALSFAAWAIGPQHGRYVMPGLAFLALFAGGGLDQILARSRKSLSWTAAALTLLLSVWFLPARVWRVSEEIQFITGRLDLEEYLLRNRNRVGLRRMDELLSLNRITPPGAKIFMLWENRGFYLQRDYLADSMFEVSYTKHLIARLGAPDNFYHWLKQNRFTYIYNGRTWKWDSDTYLQPETLAEFRKAETIYREFVDQYGQIVFRRQGELIWIK